MKRQLGFTVIEVILFLGITGLLFTVTLVVSSAFITQSRFGDGVHRIESYLQGQYDEVASGVNPRTSSWVCSASTVSAGASTPGASNCVLLGKVIAFTAGSDTFTSYYVVGSEPAAPLSPLLTTNQIIAAYNPTYVSSAGSDPYTTAWGMTFDHGKRKSDAANVANVAFIHNPLSSEILTYVFTGALPASLGLTVTAPSNSGATAAYCLKSADLATKIAAIQIVPGQGSNTVSSLFDESAAAAC